MFLWQEWAQDLAIVRVGQGDGPSRKALKLLEKKFPLVVLEPSGVKLASVPLLSSMSLVL